jgi:hypothetical protein
MSKYENNFDKDNKIVIKKNEQKNNNINIKYAIKSTNYYEPETRKSSKTVSL